MVNIEQLTRKCVSTTVMFSLMVHICQIPLFSGSNYMFFIPWCTAICVSSFMKIWLRLHRKLA